MTVEVQIASKEDRLNWNEYVCNHPDANVHHLFEWQHVIRKTYGHKSYYLFATDNSQIRYPVRGILPLIHLKHFLFGNQLLSMPFFDSGGILADSRDIEKALIEKAIKIADSLNAKTIELRHAVSLKYIHELNVLPCRITKKSHKVRMILPLPESPARLMKSFKSKLRSQIKRPQKAGLYSKIGGIELLNDFYSVFLNNMRNLGSPVHSKSLMANIIKLIPGKATIIIVYNDQEPVACSFVIGFKGILSNPWASSLRKYSRFSPNMLLYWTMLEHACHNGYEYFDFGRSSPGEGTYKFKKQWGSEPVELNWYCISSETEIKELDLSQKYGVDKAVHYWKKLPVSVTQIIGPPLRKHIGL